MYKLVCFKFKYKSKRRILKTKKIVKFSKQIMTLLLIIKKLLLLGVYNL